MTQRNMMWSRLGSREVGRRCEVEGWGVVGWGVGGR